MLAALNPIARLQAWWLRRDAERRRRAREASLAALQRRLHALHVESASQLRTIAPPRESDISPAWLVVVALLAILVVERL